MAPSPLQVLLRSCTEGESTLSSQRVTRGLSREWKSLSEVPRNEARLGGMGLLITEAGMITKLWWGF